MKKILVALAAVSLTVPALASPGRGDMVNDPMFGWSRVETVDFCLAEAGVPTFDELITDAHFDIYEGCMIEQE